VAAFGPRASIFSMLLYLVLYLQDIWAIRRWVPACGWVRPDHHRREPAADARAQCGLDLDAPHSGNDRGRRRVNPPLASTAVGVVPPQQAGTASGINSTLRQVGTTTGIACWHPVQAIAQQQRTKRPGLPQRSGVPDVATWPRPSREVQ
jgi:hypothetical protein